MASLNKVFLLGNLTRDPDLRALPSGQNVCELRLAVSRRFTSSNGQEQEETCFVDVVVWGKTAANCRQYLTKGSQVFVEGRLRLETWEDRNGGGQRSKLRVVSENIQFMNRRRDDDGSRSGNYQPGTAPQGNYQPNGGYQQQGGNYQGAYQQQSNGGNYQGGYQSNGGPARRPDAPPMPDPGFPEAADGAPVQEDDIPF